MDTATIIVAAVAAISAVVAIVTAIVRSGATATSPRRETGDAREPEAVHQVPEKATGWASPDVAARVLTASLVVLVAALVVLVILLVT